MLPSYAHQDAIAHPAFRHLLRFTLDDCAKAWRGLWFLLLSSGLLGLKPLRALLLLPGWSLQLLGDVCCDHTA